MRVQVGQRQAGEQGRAQGGRGPVGRRAARSAASPASRPAPRSRAGTPRPPTGSPSPRSAARRSPHRARRCRPGSARGRRARRSTPPGVRVPGAGPGRRTNAFCAPIATMSTTDAANPAKAEVSTSLDVRVVGGCAPAKDSSVRLGESVRGRRAARDLPGGDRGGQLRGRRPGAARHAVRGEPADQGPGAGRRPGPGAPGQAVRGRPRPGRRWSGSPARSRCSNGRPWTRPGAPWPAEPDPDLGGGQRRLAAHLVPAGADRCRPAGQLRPAPGRPGAHRRPAPRRHGDGRGDLPARRRAGLPGRDASARCATWRSPRRRWASGLRHRPDDRAQPQGPVAAPLPGGTDPSPPGSADPLRAGGGRLRRGDPAGPGLGADAGADRPRRHRRRAGWST